NWSIIGKLKTEYGIEVSSIFKLHKIMEKMGLIDHIGDSWQLTEFGRVNFTGWKDRVYNPDLWHPGIVKAIADFIKNNNIDPKKITGKW
ncbi:MAG: hypothetical protein IKE77_06190, partial [Erysipelotrichaceae bacterium]|nr:hypothetical protein [Erysipelotrichaceae bacterium]